MRNWVVLSLILGLFPIQNRAFSADFCHLTPAELKYRFIDPDLRISFANKGGYQNIGVCWWHSRLQRAAIYLVNFAPQKTKPSPEEVENILKDLVQMKRVVTIPGYSSFLKFSEDHQDSIQRLLEQWQLYDAIVNQVWIKGLKAKESLPSAQLSLLMSKLFRRFQKQGPGLWLMLKTPGVGAHAAILYDMAQNSKGYEIQVIDSNAPQMILTYVFEHGEKQIKHDDLIFVPYFGFDRDLRKIDRARQAYCKYR